MTYVYSFDSLDGPLTKHMDDALRQRLVGAAVIIALVVIFVPMLLDSPEDSVRTEQVDLTIPPRTEPGVETRRLPLDPAMTAPRPVARADEPETTEVAATPEPIVRRPEPAPPTPIPTAVKPEPVSSAAVTSFPSTVPSTAPAVPAAVRGGRFVAQFGSYAERANADALIRDLGKAGIVADIESLAGTSGRALYRVRSGGYATRAEADSARLSAQRQIAGLASNVVELGSSDPAQSNPVSPGAPTSTSGWAVQVGVFSKREGADELTTRLRGAGFAAFVEPVKLAGGQTSHRVRVGPEVKRENAAKIQAEIKAKFKLDALVVSHP